MNESLSFDILFLLLHFKLDFTHNFNGNQFNTMYHNNTAFEYIFLANSLSSNKQQAKVESILLCYDAMEIFTNIFNNLMYSTFHKLDYYL